jgi:hypothetical protein
MGRLRAESLGGEGPFCCGGWSGECWSCWVSMDGGGSCAGVDAADIWRADGG